MPLEHFFNEQGLTMQGLGDSTKAQDLSFLYGNRDDLLAIQLPASTHLTDMSFLDDPDDPHDLPFDQWGMPQLNNTHDTRFVTIEHSRDPQGTTFDLHDLPATLSTDLTDTSFLNRDPHELPLYLQSQDSVDMDEYLNDILRQLQQPLPSHDELPSLQQDIAPQTRQLQKIQWTNPLQPTNPPITRRRRPNATPEERILWNNQRTRIFWQQRTPEQKEEMNRQRQARRQQLSSEEKNRRRNAKVERERNRHADIKKIGEFITEYYGVPSQPSSRESITSTLKNAKEAYAKDSGAIAGGRKKHFEQLTPESLRRKALRWAEDSETFHNTSSEDEGE